MKKDRESSEGKNYTSLFVKKKSFANPFTKKNKDAI